MGISGMERIMKNLLIFVFGIFVGGCVVKIIADTNRELSCLHATSFVWTPVRLALMQIADDIGSERYSSASEKTAKLLEIWSVLPEDNWEAQRLGNILVEFNQMPEKAKNGKRLHDELSE